MWIEVEEHDISAPKDRNPIVLNLKAVVKAKASWRPDLTVVFIGGVSKDHVTCIWMKYEEFKKLLPITGPCLTTKDKEGDS